MDRTDQERRLQVFRVFDEGVLGHVGALRKIFEAQLLAGVVGQGIEQAVELLDIADAIQDRQIA